MNTTMDSDAPGVDIWTFEAKYEQLRKKTLRSVRKITAAQDADKEDAVQAAALGVWCLLRGGGPKKPIKAFRTYFANASINAQNKKNSRNREEPSEDVEKTVDPQSQVDLSDERELWARRRAWLPDAVRDLPKSEQNVVKLRLAGLEDGKIGAQLEIGHDSVPVVHSRAVARLKKMARKAGLMFDSPNLSL